MILYAEWVIYTAHLAENCNRNLYGIARLVWRAEDSRKYVKEIKAALGREQIILKNGGRVVFVARTRNGGRGLHGDCLVFDEAQELDKRTTGFIPAGNISIQKSTDDLFGNTTG